MKYAIFIIMSLIALSNTYASTTSSYSPYQHKLSKQEKLYTSLGIMPKFYNYCIPNGISPVVCKRDQNYSQDQQGGLLGTFLSKNTSCECYYFPWNCGCWLHSHTSSPMCGPC